jgi:hypothetical protein
LNPAARGGTVTDRPEPEGPVNQGFNETQSGEASSTTRYGGKAEILDPTETGSTCTRCGGPWCLYPWFTRNHDGSFTYGVTPTARTA